MEVNNREELIDLNTRGCCFLCLQSKQVNIDESRQSHSIRCLLQHLQIKYFEEQHFKNEIGVDLCENCKTMLNDYTVAFEELQKAQIKINYFLEKINKSISGPGGDSTNVQVYTNRMTEDPKGLAQIALVNNLRRELAIKSLEMRSGPIPCVNLERIELIPTSEIKEEPCNDEEEDLSTFEDLNPDNFETPEFIVPSMPSQHQEDSKDEVHSTIYKNDEAGSSKNQRRLKYCVKTGGTYHCIKCEKNFRHKTNLVRHFKSIHLQKKFKCDICNISVFTYSTGLASHKKTCRETLDGRLAKEKEKEGFKYKCNQCGKKFKLWRTLATHRLDVHGNVNYACDLCDKKFTNSCNLKRHKNAVHLGKVFHCRFCNQKIIYKHHLRTHERNCVQKDKIRVIK